MKSMLALIRYQLQLFARTYRYFAPMSLYLIFIAWIYSMIPNPVMSSYASTSVCLFFVAAWLAFNFYAAEPPAQQQLTLMHSRGGIRYHASRMATVWVAAFPLTLFAVLYPIIRGSFDRAPTAIEMAVSLYAHLLFTWMAIVLTALFCSKIGTQLISKLGGLVLTMIMSLAVPGLNEWLPYPLRWLLWVLPPASLLIDSLMNFDTLGELETIAKLGWPLLYTMVLFLLTIVYLQVRRK
ncbi:hypothetical protein [Paenibacillus sp. J2TS4]|uniref:hypothetical protein n=1 Tax=Paenibacillus sp. J2TS4 TaxID=2807194 RepID=UPI001B1FEF15|nr:hypothetical protein [Paenibacillus sp. J2TS4]GIP33277.1 ABC transporter permease [Paenibacillus sp. J2TS4]